MADVDRAAVRAHRALGERIRKQPSIAAQLTSRSAPPISRRS